MDTFVQVKTYVYYISMSPWQCRGGWKHARAYKNISCDPIGYNTTVDTEGIEGVR